MYYELHFVEIFEGKEVVGRIVGNKALKILVNLLPSTAKFSAEFGIIDRVNVFNVKDGQRILCPRASHYVTEIAKKFL